MVMTGSSAVSRQMLQSNDELGLPSEACLECLPAEGVAASALQQAWPASPSEACLECLAVEGAAESALQQASPAPEACLECLPVESAAESLQQAWPAAQAQAAAVRACAEGQSITSQATRRGCEAMRWLTCSGQSGMKQGGDLTRQGI